MPKTKSAKIGILDVLKQLQIIDFFTGIGTLRNDCSFDSRDCLNASIFT